jgi:cytosine deaminase
MSYSASSILQLDHYWLCNAHVPVSLLTQPMPEMLAQQTREGLTLVDIEIQQGKVKQILVAGTIAPPADRTLDLRQGLVWCSFVDMHTHLDKGHIWERSPNLSGSFSEAMQRVKADQDYCWQPEDVYRRMEFGLKCSYAHGTQAIRTHLDVIRPELQFSLEAFKTLRHEWRDRLTLQAVPLLPIEQFSSPMGEKLADQFTELGGVLGGLVLMSEELDRSLDRVFAMAKERQMNLDFHTDESGNPNDMTLRHVAQAALRHEFSGQIICGHCCSLSVQTPATVLQTLQLVKAARIGIVSLPMCNLYLQDRNQEASEQGQLSGDAIDWESDLPTWQQFKSHTPRWRGVTLLHELKYSDIPVAVASDNCRDPFYAFGDHDVLEVFAQAVRIAHLDAPYGEWCRIVTTTPADLMGLATVGRIAVGLSADLILYRARYLSELLSRSQHDRVVLRAGQPIDTTLPDYAELD